MSDLVRIGSTIYSWNSQSFRFDGVPYQDLLSVDLDEKRNRKLVYGARRAGTPLGMTTGKYDPGQLVIGMLADSAQLLLNQLAIKGLGSYGDATDVVFSATVFEPAPGAVSPLMLLASGMSVVGVKDSRAEGIDELITEITFQPLAVMRNGLRISSLIRSLPI